MTTRHAVITGASAGLGRALARALAAAGWRLTIDARHPEPLEQTRRELAAHTTVQAVTGDVADPLHRRSLVAAAAAAGPVDLLVNNASTLGGSPPPWLRDLDPDTLTRVLSVNVVGPQALTRALLPQLAPLATILNVTSDAAVDHYEGWGGYAAAKAALDHLTLTWAAEEPQHHWYAVDPGDLRTAMHQAAFPDEDISDRPEPESVVPDLLRLLDSGLPSGRYRASEISTRIAESQTPTGSGSAVDQPGDQQDDQPGNERDEQHDDPAEARLVGSAP
jgi:NAD(P)-dependent dehydrogenase (short-subunit alcohol dehydrogenase family)